MKKIFTIGLAFTAGLGCLLAQAPAKISYQAVVRNSSGAIVPLNTTVAFRFTIRDGSGSGTNLYQETQSKLISNNFGLANLEIGSGTLVSGSFPNATSWGGSAKFLQIEIDPTGGSSWSDMGAVELISVPYAMYSNGAGTANSATTATTATTATNYSGNINLSQISGTGVSSGNTLSWNGSTWVPVTPNAGDITDVVAGTGLSGGATSGSATLNATNGTAMWNADKIQGLAVTSGASSNQVLRFNSPNWVASNETVTTAGTGITISAGTISTPWTVSGSNVFNNNAGSVGIGTNAPSSILHVKGLNGVITHEFTNKGWDNFYYKARYIGYMGIYSDTNNLEIGTSGVGKDLTFSTAAAPKMTLTKGGSLGIGTTTPNFQLHMVSTVPVIQNSNATTGATSGDGFVTGFNTSVGESLVWSFESQDLVLGTNGSERIRLKSAGGTAVSGALSKGSGTFKIDHPLDPENKYLYHSFVESPDMMNIYNGVVAVDEKGEAIVEMPAYFEALNMDFRYQLTCIGGFAPVYIAEKIANNKFKIAGGTKGIEVSWQVTGIRHDAFANQHRVVPEVDKDEADKGYYEYPEAIGQPKEKGISYHKNIGTTASGKPVSK